MKRYPVPTDSEAVSSAIKTFVSRADSLIARLLPLHEALGRAPFDEKDFWILSSLSNACLRTSGSLFLLLEHEKEWDGTILDRSIFEGTLKFLYLLESKGAFRERLVNYSEVHFDVCHMKDHGKAERFLEAVRGTDLEDSPRVLAMMIDPERLQELKQKHSRGERQQTDRLWGVDALLAALGSGKSPFRKLYPGFLHGYAMSSHVCHMDSIGVEIVSERYTRNIERQLAARLAHATGLLSNAVSYALMRVYALHAFLPLDDSALQDCFQEHALFADDISAVQDMWERIEFRASQ